MKPGVLKMKYKLLGVSKDEAGVTLVEYGIALALGIAVGAPTLIVLAGTISGRLSQAGTSMTIPPA